jgi:hypothetical protein
MVGGAIKAQVDTERHRRPGRVLRIAVEAYLRARKALANNDQNTGPQTWAGWWLLGNAHLVCGLQLQLLKDLLRLRLGGTHDWRGRGKSGEVESRE